MLERLLLVSAHRSAIRQRRRRTPSAIIARFSHQAPEMVAALLKVERTGHRTRTPGESNTTSPAARAARACATARSRSPRRASARPWARAPAPARGAVSPIRYAAAQRSATAAPAARSPRPCRARPDHVHAALEAADADDRRSDVGRLGVVDVESRRRRVATSSSRCATPANVSSPSRTAPRVDAARQRTAAAAIAFSRLCGPRSRMSAAAITGSPRHHSMPLRGRRASAPRPAAPKLTKAPRGRRPQRRRARGPPGTIASVPAAGGRRSRSLAAR